MLVTEIAAIAGIIISSSSVGLAAATFVFNTGSQIRKEAFSVVITVLNGKYHLSNTSLNPIFEIQLWSGESAETIQKDMVPRPYLAGGESFSYTSHTGRTDLATSLVSVIFRDSRALTWRRYEDGRLILLYPSNKFHPTRIITRAWFTATERD